MEDWSKNSQKHFVSPYGTNGHFATSKTTSSPRITGSGENYDELSLPRVINTPNFLLKLIRNNTNPYRYKDLNKLTRLILISTAMNQKENCFTFRLDIKTSYEEFKKTFRTKLKRIPAPYWLVPDLVKYNNHVHGLICLPETELRKILSSFKTDYSISKLRKQPEYYCHYCFNKTNDYHGNNRAKQLGLQQFEKVTAVKTF